MTDPHVGCCLAPDFWLPVSIAKRCIGGDGIKSLGERFPNLIAKVNYPMAARHIELVA